MATASDSPSWSGTWRVEIRVVAAKPSRLVGSGEIGVTTRARSRNETHVVVQLEAHVVVQHEAHVVVQHEAHVVVQHGAHEVAQHGALEVAQYEAVESRKERTITMAASARRAWLHR